MATYLTTYSAGISKMTMAGNHDPADATSPPWDPAVDPDTGHPSAADKPIHERVPWEVVPPTEDPAEEQPVGETTTEGVPADPPVGQTAEPAVEGAPA